MTPNNLHGHNKDIKWGEVYKEKLDDTWSLVVTLSKECSEKNYPHVCIQCVVTTGQTKTYSNGVISYIEHPTNYWVSENTELLSFTTKDGFICEQYVSSTNEDEKMVRLDWKTDVTPEYLLLVTQQAS